MYRTMGEVETINVPEHDLNPLNGVRGLCALFIVVGHMLTFWTPQYDIVANYNATTGVLNFPPDYPQFGLEYLSAVTLFFIISGFTLVSVYDRRCNDPNSPSPFSSWAEQSTFFGRRLARLAPVYYLGLLFGIAPLIVYSDAMTIAFSVPFALLWIQSITIVGNGWNGPLWNASAFAFCYLFFPRILSRSRTLGPSRLLWAIFWCSLTSWVMYLIFGVLLGLWGLVHIFAPFRLCHFFIGVFLGILSRKTSLLRPTLVCEITTAVLIADFLICAILGTRNGNIFFFWAELAEFVFPPVHALWIFALTSPTCDGPTRSFLLSPPLRALGQISYTIYCLHFPLITWCNWAVMGRGVSAAAVPGITQFDTVFYFSLSTWSIIPITIIIMIVAAGAFYLIEEPARRYLSGRRARPPPESATLPGAADKDAAGCPPAGQDKEMTLSTTAIVVPAPF